MTAIEARVKADTKNQELDIIAHNKVLEFLDTCIYPEIEKCAEKGRYNFSERMPLYRPFSIGKAVEELTAQGYTAEYDEKTGVLTIAW